jgi:hypothetical protein
MVGLATLVLRNIMAAHTYRKLPLLLLTAGVGFVIVADVSFWFQGAAAGWNSSGEFDAAGWDYLYMLGWAMVAAGALLPTADALRRRREAPASDLVRPALGLLVALPVMLALAHSTAPVGAALALTGIIAARTLLFVVDTAGINRRSRMMVAVAGEIVVERQPDAPRVEDWLRRIMGPSAAHLRQLDDGDCPRAIAVVPLARSLHSSPTVICVHDWRNRGTRSELLQFARLFAAAYPSVGVGPVADVSPDSAPGAGVPGSGAFEPVDGG